MIELILCASLMAYDGDDVRCDGENLRIVGDGIPNVITVDAPELQGRECQAELLLGRLAKQRLQELLDEPGVVIEETGEVTRYGRSQRRLVRVRMPDGRTAGAILQEEGLAGVWTPEDGQQDWCGSIPSAE